MADLVITPANVKPGSGAQFEERPADEAIVQGEVVFPNVTGAIINHSLSSNGSDTDSAIRGIAVNCGDSGQPVKVQVSGEINLGAVLTIGEIYVVSANSGKIAPVADLLIGDFVTIIGVAITASILKLGILISGAVKP